MQRIERERTFGDGRFGAGDREVCVGVAEARGEEPAATVDDDVDLVLDVRLLRVDRDWWKREDAEARIVHGPAYE